MSEFSAAVANQTKIRLLALMLAMEIFTLGDCCHCCRPDHAVCRLGQGASG